jgi:hypothetical protein
MGVDKYSYSEKKCGNEYVSHRPDENAGDYAIDWASGRTKLLSIHKTNQ